MTRRAQVRRAVMWSGGAVSALIGIVWAASQMWHFGWGTQPTSVVYVTSGALLFGASGPPIVPTSPARFFAGPKRDAAGWGFHTLVAVPLWMPLALTLLPTAIALRLDAEARRRTGACVNCGYDRAGIAAGALCPECGTAPTPA